jgi:hypothetical protein
MRDPLTKGRWRRVESTRMREDSDPCWGRTHPRSIPLCFIAYHPCNVTTPFQSIPNDGRSGYGEGDDPRKGQSVPQKYTQIQATPPEKLVFVDANVRVVALVAVLFSSLPPPPRPDSW